MTIRRLNRLGALALLFVIDTTMAVEPRTEHTFMLSEGETAPAATLEDARWMSGSWTGTAFGKKFEEVWSVRSAGTMVG